MVKKFFKNIKAKCKGFSLMELIVTIAIMAVLAAVLAPALIHYVEDSRAAKDDHAMSEVVNAVKVALAYDDVYDEIIDDITWKNSCYVDSDSPNNDNIEYLFVDDNEKGYKSYIYKDVERELDETPYKFAGRMYGATVTFRPNNENVIEIKDGVYSGNNVQGKKISEMSEENVLYTKIKQVIGNKIELTSATYKNSQFTVFICFGVEAEKTQSETKVTLSDEPMVIYGQWSGTNLLTIEMQDPGLDDTPDFNTLVQDGVIPEGGDYGFLPESRTCWNCGYDFENPRCSCGYTLEHGTVVNGICTNCDFDFASGRCLCGDTIINQNREPVDLQPGDVFPSEPQPLDIYTYGDYTYVYGAYYFNYPANRYNDNYDGTFKDNGKEEWLVYPTEYKKTLGPWLVEIAGKPVVNTQYFLFELYSDTTPQVESITIPNNIPYLSDYFFESVIGNVNTINFMGTKSEWEQMTTARDYNYIFSYNELLTNTVHCTDGDVCIEHTGGTASCSSKATCTVCGIKYGNIKSHTGGTATCTTKRTCTVCGQQYGSTASHTGGTATCITKRTCTVCGQQYGSYMPHTGGTATCTAKKTCTVCGQQYGLTISHSIVNGKCPMCGLDNNEIVFQTNEYVNYVSYKVLGTWEFTDCDTVDITVTCNTERNYDYIMLAVGDSFVSGTSPSSSYSFISTSGTIGTCTASSLSGSSTSIYKFTSDSTQVDKTWTLKNVPAPKGSVIVYTDVSVLGDGATITVKKSQ